MKIDLHVHTSEVSGCGKLPGAEMARLYRRAGYDGIVVTDHLIAGMRAQMPVSERAEWYVSGYRAAREEGERLGLTVLLGAELRFAGGIEDYLLFGLSPEDIPWIMERLDAGVRLDAFYPMIRESGRFVLIQAHPFREGIRCAPEAFLDGVEVYNGANANHQNHNDLSLAFARAARPGFIQTSGSDAHMTQQVGHGGLVTDLPIRTEGELAAWLREHPVAERIEE